MKRVKKIILILFIFLLPLYSQFDAKKIYNKCADGVVYISTPHGFGSGFFINIDGWILTNLHVISDEYGDTYQKYSIKVFTRGSSKYYNPEIVKTYKRYDLALLKINYVPRVIIPLADKNEISVGEEAVAIGHPSGLEWTQTKGSVSKTYDELIQTDISINPGNSGGPILNSYGQMIGIATVKFLNIETTNIGIRVNVIKDYLDYEGIQYSTKPLIQSAEKDNLENEWETLKNKKRELEEERKQFEQEKIEFFRLKEESRALLEKGDELRELKVTLEKKQRLIEEKETNINNTYRKIENDLKLREIDLENKIKQYSYIYPEHFALEVLSNNGYFVGKNIKSGNFLLGATATLLFRFDFSRVTSSNSYSKANRFGVQYLIFRNYGDEKYKIFDNVQQFAGLILDFNESLRLGGGVEVSKGKNVFSERLIYFTLGIYFKPDQFTFLLDSKAFSHQEFKDTFYSVGLSIGYTGNFLRW